MGRSNNPAAACIDGLDPRQWGILRALQRPGERFPLLLVTAGEGSFRTTLAAWIDEHGTTEIRSLADLSALATAWTGAEPPLAKWNSERCGLEREARAIVAGRSRRAAAIVAESRAAQLEAARLRLIEELGRLLICSAPDTEDLNGKLYRLAGESNPTAERLCRVLHRLGGYPSWQPAHIARLRAVREALSPAQIKTRLTGREIDAALDDPRWAFADAVAVTHQPEATDASG